jgi:hypothetical protein
MAIPTRPLITRYMSVPAWPSLKMRVSWRKRTIAVRGIASTQLLHQRRLEERRLERRRPLRPRARGEARGEEAQPVVHDAREHQRELGAAAERRLQLLRVERVARAGTRAERWRCAAAGDHRHLAEHLARLDHVERLVADAEPTSPSVR